jgi:hypothetical protein
MWIFHSEIQKTTIKLPSNSLHNLSARNDRCEGNSVRGGTQKQKAKQKGNFQGRIQKKYKKHKKANRQNKKKQSKNKNVFRQLPVIFRRLCKTPLICSSDSVEQAILAFFK